MEIEIHLLTYCLLKYINLLFLKITIINADKAIIILFVLVSYSTMSFNH